MNAGKKLIKAKAGLVLSSPFFASIALRLKLEEDKNCETAYTDSVVLGYNPKFIGSLSDAEVKAVICHEVLHIAMLHPFRRNNREPEKWNIACDYAINQIVKDSGYMLPQGTLLEGRFKDMEAEVIYSKLPEQIRLPAKAVLIGNVKDYKQDMSNKESLPAAQQEKNWKITLTSAATIAKAQGKLPGGLDRMIQKVLAPKISWQELLSGFVTQNARNDYNWKLPNKRYIYSGIYLPELNVPELGNIAVIIDTSGSVSQKELSMFAAELRAILTIYPGTEINVIYVDHEVAGVETLDINDLELHAKGGGGTDFKPGFEYIEKEQIMPACAIYFTDGWCRSFPVNPEFPTLWVLTERSSFSPPFGDVIHIE